VINIPATKRYLLGCDLAKSLDFTSFAVIEMETPEAENSDSIYHLVNLDRIRGVNYPTITELIISAIKRLEKEAETVDGPHLCMDASGLGAPIRDYLKATGMFDHFADCGWGVSRIGKYPKEERKPEPKVTPKEIYPVVFTGGEAARHDEVTGNYNISKTLIISNFLSLMQHRRFDYASDLEALPLLEQEIASFKRHTTSSGKTGFDAEAGEHDDLICAVCIPLIIGEWKYSRAQNSDVGWGTCKRRNEWL
jgi:hypothetical protein